MSEELQMYNTSYNQITCVWCVCVHVCVVCCIHIVILNVIERQQARWRAILCYCMGMSVALAFFV